ncbi:MAG: prolyl aminopeptidase, partial [Brevundimonas sp.]|nr:prolyl aminopeptidase [Brevundimonas sp.]
MAFPVPETSRRDLFPEIEPYASGFMPTDGVHEIWYEECGNPQGLPVVVLH